MLRKKFLFLILSAVMAVWAGSALADTSVSWVSPPDGSSYLAGTTLGPGDPDGAITGVAGASGGNAGTGLDLMLVIDTSGSMGGAGIAAAKSAAIALINALPDNTTQVGIVEFDSSASVYRQLQDLTTNKAALTAAVNALTTGGVTAIGSGINAATGELISSRAIAGHAKMMVVLSDGYNNSGSSPTVAATAAAAQGITIHTVGVPGHDASLMSQIATIGGGVYTNVTSLATLEGIFSGTGGNLVNLDHVDIQLADGSWINDIPTDGLGNFILPSQVIALGANTFTAHAYGTDGTSASAELTLYGTTNAVPEPTTMLLFGTGLAGLAAFGRRRKA